MRCLVPRRHLQVSQARSLLATEHRRGADLADQLVASQHSVAAATSMAQRLQEENASLKVSGSGRQMGVQSGLWERKRMGVGRCGWCGLSSRAAGM